MKSPLLLRAECENGLLNGRFMETKQRLEAALRGFAAQADESAMLAMMAMLGLLYVQVGDLHEAETVHVAADPGMGPQSGKLQRLRTVGVGPRVGERSGTAIPIR